MRMQSTRWLPAVCLAAVLTAGVSGVESHAAEPPAPAAPTGHDLDIEPTFAAPPMAVRPWVYWWWLNANVSEKSITADLEALAAQGVGGFLLFDVTAYGHHIVAAPPRTVEFMSPRWRQLVRFALEEAHRLGLQASINLSTCGGALRAPWSMEQHAVKKLVWASTEVDGPAAVELDRPECTAPYYHPVAVVAARIGPAGEQPRVGPTSDWSPVADPLPDDTPTAAEVVDLSDRVDAAGRLRWQAPAGRWRVVRLACVVMEDRTEDVDILNAQAVEAHFDRMGRALLTDAGPLAGGTLTHFYNVSWEGETPTWTPGFERDFRKFRGYDIRPYLPALAGIRITDVDTTARFLADYSRTISDCFMENCYARFDALCREAGLRWHSESGGPWTQRSLLFREADQLAFWGRNDMPQGEFWVVRYRSNARPTAAAAHLYGRRLASVEAFTHMQHHWSQYPASLKGAADMAFCDGINQFVWHTSPASPDEFGLPGIVYFAGTHFNRQVTWFDYSRGFVDYLARCQALLRRGHFVADLCVYTSHKNNIVWTRGPQWSEKATLSPPPGYAYDQLNAEVLAERMTVPRPAAVQAEGGGPILAADEPFLVLPDGMRYRMLVLDLDEPVMPVEALRKVVELVEAGATVVLGERKPETTPGLKDREQAEEELRRLAARLWDGPAGARPLGKGTVISGTPPADALKQAGILPDFEGAEHYIHRRDGGTDIYFVAGEGRVDLTFRAEGRQPEIWDPVRGTITPAARYTTDDDGRVTVPMTLPQNGSVFIVFREPPRGPHITAANGPARITLGAPRGNKVPIGFWKEGRYAFGMSANRTVRRGLSQFSRPTERLVQSPDREGRENGTVPLASDRRQPAPPAREQLSETRQFEVNITGLPEPMELDRAWQVAFAPGWGAPASVAFDRLVPWNTHADDAVKYFSGTATYRKRIELTDSQAAGLIRLRLGEVGCIARVRLNGKDLGVVWTDPWSVDLTGAAAAGENRLEIDVANVWQNRLIGDAHLPEADRRTRTNVILEQGERTRRFLCSSINTIDALTPSGLIGPVRLEFGREKVVAVE